MGGVRRPIIRFKTITRPRCTGLMPSFKAMGIIMGVRMIIGRVGFHKAAHYEQEDVKSMRITKGLVETSKSLFIK